MYVRLFLSCLECALTVSTGGRTLCVKYLILGGAVLWESDWCRNRSCPQECRVRAPTGSFTSYIFIRSLGFRFYLSPPMFILFMYALQRDFEASH
jgi:hypothetical protein